MRDVAAHWDRLELAGRGELLYATGVPLPLRHQPAGQDLRQLSSPRHGIDLSLRCSQGLVSAELVIDLGAGADLAAAERVRDSQLDHHCQLLRELLDIQMDGCQWLTAAGRAPTTSNTSASCSSVARSPRQSSPAASAEGPFKR